MSDSIWKCDECGATGSGTHLHREVKHSDIASNTKCTGRYHRIWTSENSFGVNSERAAQNQVDRYRAEEGCMARYVKTGIGRNQYTGEEQFLYDVYYRYPVTADYE